jgi:hypothetical protein
MSNNGLKNTLEYGGMERHVNEQENFGIAFLYNTKEALLTFDDFTLFCVKGTDNIGVSVKLDIDKAIIIRDELNLFLSKVEG